MSGELMRTWRGDHTRLLLLVAGQLTSADQEVAAEAAAVLEACHAIAAPVREALVAHIDAQRAAHGPGVWAASDVLLRRSHQACGNIVHMRRALRARVTAGVEAEMQYSDPAARRAKAERRLRKETALHDAGGRVGPPRIMAVFVRTAGCASFCVGAR